MTHDPRIVDIEAMVEDIAHVLPSQGPIDVFIHHNTLHSFEDTPFEEALEEAAKLYGANPYWDESRYQAEYRRGRITEDDLAHVLLSRGATDRPVVRGLTDVALRKLALITAPQVRTRAEVLWSLTETGELDHPIEGEAVHEEFGRAVLARDNAFLRGSRTQRTLGTLFERVQSRLGRDASREIDLELRELVETFKDDSQAALGMRSRRLLWFVCLDEAIHALLESDLSKVRNESPTVPSGRRTRVDQLVQPYLIKFAAAFLDQGLAGHSLPGRELGLLKCFLLHLENGSAVHPWWLGDAKTLDLAELGSRSSAELLERELRHLGLRENQWHSILLEKALALRGWSGFMHVFESRADLHPPVKAAHDHALMDFLAVRMLLERMASTALGAAAVEESPPQPERWMDHIYTRAYRLFRTCLAAFVGGSDLLGLSHDERRRFVRVLFELGRSERLIVWHRAYEWNFESRVYRAVVAHRHLQPDHADRTNPCYQLIFCIDEREESIRRYFEELDSRIETFGTAGFFSIDAAYQPLGRKAAPSCPIVINPTHRVREVAVAGKEKRVRTLQRLRHAHGTVSSRINIGSRGAVRGTLISMAGSLAFLPLAVGTVFPRLSRRMARLVKKVFPDQLTELIYESTETDDSESSGFAQAEMVDRVEATLRGIGLIKRFAPMIVLFGHGSYSRNNPYRSAYDCGACGGRPGEMNPRVFALMANRPDVRAGLKDRGITVPDSTVFVGGFHNTTSDEIRFFDVHALDEAHQDQLTELAEIAETARRYNAYERSRRFVYSDVHTPDDALRHVESRAFSIAEPRPEYGHATNAMCVVGRRQHTKGLFLDRRAFLVSYDPTIDESGNILLGTLSAVVPVCMGINLEYFFSAIDNTVYGAGSKLPMNVASLIGMMTGSTSDLRTGLPSQMVEIHEPVRLVTIIETTEARMRDLMEKSPMLRRCIMNRWILVTLMDPSTGKLSRLANTGEFEPVIVDQLFLDRHPLIGESLHWCAELDGALPFASLRTHSHTER